MKKRLPIVIGFSILLLTSCGFPAAPVSDFGRTPKTIFSEAVRLYLKPTGQFDRGRAIQFFNEATEGLDRDAFDSLMQANGAQCREVEEGIHCASTVVWYLLLQDRHAKCDHPIGGERKCLIVDVVDVTYAPVAPFKLKTIHIVKK